MSSNKGILSRIDEVKLFSANLTNEDLRKAFEESKPKYTERKPTKEEKWFGKNIWPKMSSEEQMELVILSMNGIIQGDIVLMGSTAFNRYMDYKKQMIEKYDIARN